MSLKIRDTNGYWYTRQLIYRLVVYVTYISNAYNIRVNIIFVKFLNISFIYIVYIIVHCFKYVNCIKSAVGKNVYIAYETWLYKISAGKEGNNVCSFCTDISETSHINWVIIGHSVTKYTTIYKSLRYHIIHVWRRHMHVEKT